MFRSIFLTVLLIATTLAAPSPVSRKIFTCSNRCLPFRNFPCPSKCQSRRCTFRFGNFFRTRGTSCTVKPSPTPSVTPTPTPAPTISRCEFNVVGNLEFTCDCTDSAGGSTTATVDLGAKFSGDDRFSKSCFESCLAGETLPVCVSDLNQSGFEDAVNDNFNFCCSSCDAEVRNGVCFPFSD